MTWIGYLPYTLQVFSTQMSKSSGEKVDLSLAALLKPSTPTRD